MTDSRSTPAIPGLRYIADSPPEIHGGFREETIAIAKAALEQIASLESELARVKAEKWFVTDLDKVKQERDEWKAVAQALYEGHTDAEEDYASLQAKSP
jgi:hypothetical protein